MSLFVDFFDATIGSILKTKLTLIEVISTTPIHDILNIFKNNEITSIPIYELIEINNSIENPSNSTENTAENTSNSTENSSNSSNNLIVQGKKYIGIISMVDILAFILKIGDDDTSDSLSHQVKYVLGSTQESLSINLSIESEDTPLSVIVEKMSQGKIINYYLFILFIYF